MNIHQKIIRKITISALARKTIFLLKNKKYSAALKGNYISLTKPPWKAGRQIRW